MDAMNQWQKIQDKPSIKNDILDASKEALVHIMNKFSIDSIPMMDAGLSIRNAISATRLKESDKENMHEMRNTVLGIVRGKLEERGMATPDIIDEFEKELNDRLPTQMPE